MEQELASRRLAGVGRGGWGSVALQPFEELTRVHAARLSTPRVTRLPVAAAAPARTHTRGRGPPTCQSVSCPPAAPPAQERWDFHASVVMARDGHGLISDCTHFCYSPSFWELSFHDLYVVLANSSAWLQRRHEALARGMVEH
eukprot:1718819-Prymnesium_polylepis.1